MRKLFLLFACVATLLTACQKPENGGGGVSPTPPSTPVNPPTPPNPSTPIVVASGTDLNPVISVEGGSTQIRFTANDSWTVSIVETKSVDWISVDKTSGGAGDITLNVTVSPNDTYDSRKAALQIKSGSTVVSIEFTQEKAETPYIRVSQTEYEVGCGGGEIEIKVECNTWFSMSWGAYWLWLQSSGQESPNTYNYIFHIEKNYSNESRTTEITVDNKDIGQEFVVTVTQAASNIVEFYDQNFKSYCVKNFDADGDGEVSIDEAKSAREIDYVSESVDLKGLDTFVNLETLKLNSGKSDVESARTCGMSCGENISALSKLKHLECRYLPLYSLDVSNMPDLEYLDIEATCVNNLDVSKNKKLTYLDCSPMQYNYLRILSVSKGQSIPNVTENRSSDYVPDYTVIYADDTSTGSNEGTMEGGEI